MKRTVLVGAGGMGRAWARVLNDHPNIELVAWADLSREVVEGACQETSVVVPLCSGNLQEVLDLHPDLLVDVTVPEAHRDVTVAALEAGIPVLGEKPMAASMNQAVEMVRASERVGKLYMVSQSRRYNAGLRSFQRLISDRIGNLGILNSDFYLGPHFGGFRDEMESPLLLDMAIHTFDAARFLSGADPLSVYAEEFNPSWSWFKGNACATVIFEMTGGLRFTYRGSWCAEGLMTSWESDWRAVGERGTAKWDGDSPATAETTTSDSGFIRPSEKSTAFDSRITEGILGALDECLTSLETGSIPQGECHDNIKSLAMVFGAIESARRRERIEIAEILDL